MHPRNGKIARLPHELREQLNLRLLRGEPGVELVAWLNSDYQVQAVVEEEFGGRPISEQNLSEWKHGGFLEWQARREIFNELAGAVADNARFAVAGASPEEMLRVLAQRYAAALNEWTATGNRDAAVKMHSVKSVSAYAFALSNDEIRRARLRLSQDRLALAREKHEARQGSQNASSAKVAEALAKAGNPVSSSPAKPPPQEPSVPPNTAARQPTPSVPPPSPSTIPHTPKPAIPASNPTGRVLPPFQPPFANQAARSINRERPKSTTPRQT